MERKYWTRFADDLREHVGLRVNLTFDAAVDGLHVLTINGVDFFFNSDGSGYDGWGCNLGEEWEGDE